MERTMFFLRITLCGVCALLATVGEAIAQPVSPSPPVHRPFDLQAVADAVSRQGIPAGRWRVEFANGVVERCDLLEDSTAKVSEPFRASNGRVVVGDRLAVIVFADDRLERWTKVGTRCVVEHWYPASRFATDRPVIGIADPIAEKEVGAAASTVADGNETALSERGNKLAGQAASLRIPIGRWRVEFSNSVKELCETLSDGASLLHTPERIDGGKASVESNWVRVTLPNGRIQRWTRVGSRQVVEHWFPDSAFDPLKPGTIGIADYLHSLIPGQSRLDGGRQAESEPINQADPRDG